MKKLAIIIIAVLSLSSCSTFQPLTKSTIKEFNDESVVNTFYKASNAIVFENKYTEMKKSKKMYVTKKVRISGYGKVIEDNGNSLLVNFKKGKNNISLIFNMTKSGEYVVANEQVSDEKHYKLILGDGAVLTYKPHFSSKFVVIMGKKK